MYMPHGKSVLVMRCHTESDSVNDNMMFGAEHTAMHHMAKMLDMISGFDRSQCFFKLKSFIYVEYKCCFSLSDSKVKAHVSAFLEFPSVAYATIRKQASPSEFRWFSEYRA